MNVRPYDKHYPEVAASAYVDEAAVVIGRVTIDEESSVWPNAVVRGDVNFIRIGARSNIQDGSVIHVTHDHEGALGGFPTVVGDEVTVGHMVTLHGCEIGDRCLVGMGSIVLDGAVLEPRVLLGAGSLVPPGKQLEGGYLWMGRPAERIRPLTSEELDGLEHSARHYVQLSGHYKQGGG